LNQDVKFQILKAAKNLKEINIKNETKISICPDMTKLEKERHKQLVNFRDIENKKLEQRSDFSTLDYYFGIRGTRVIEIKKVINRI
jgi:hypothetical protein